MKISVILYRNNQITYISDAIRSILNQALPSSDELELIVVDNHSSADTRDVVEKLAITCSAQIHYISETEQGRGFALNTGVHAAKGEILIITSDDIIAERGWLASILEAFNRSGTDGVGGPVLPLWKAERPSWLEEDLFCKIGLINYGSEGRLLDVDHIPIGCNVAFRREVFDRFGLYNTGLGRTKEVLLSDDDDEFFTRILCMGCRIYYEPMAVVLRRVPAERMRRSYLRRLEVLSGMSNAQVFDPKVNCLLSIPRYYYRRMIETLFQWFWFLLTGRWNRAFCQELFLWYLMGYVRARWVKKAGVLKVFIR